MPLHRFDLNLLIALDALLREKNVTRAAERLYVTQPSMSGALQRLRDYFGDQLLVRVGRELELTPKAQSLLKPVREILLLTQHTLEIEPTFDPATARRKFTLMMSDYCNIVFLPHLTARLAREAPGVQFHVEDISGSTYASLESGEVDLCIIPDDARLFGPVDFASNLERTPLFADRWVCAVAHDHLAVDDQLTRELYFKLPHVTAYYGGGTMTVEQFSLSGHWADVKVEAAVPGFAAMLFLLPGTEFIATVQKRLADVLSKAVSIRTFAPPIEVPDLQETLVWHQRSHFDPGHVWLRQLCTEIANSLDQ